MHETYLSNRVLIMVVMARRKEKRKSIHRKARKNESGTLLG